jgi:hypothetical protein
VSGICEIIAKRMKVYKGMFRPWNPMKEDIEIWLKTNDIEFS